MGSHLGPSLRKAILTDQQLGYKGEACLTEKHSFKNSPNFGFSSKTNISSHLANYPASIFKPMFKYINMKTDNIDWLHLSQVSSIFITLRFNTTRSHTVYGCHAAKALWWAVWDVARGGGVRPSNMLDVLTKIHHLNAFQLQCIACAFTADINLCFSIFRYVVRVVWRLIPHGIRA